MPPVVASQLQTGMHAALKYCILHAGQLYCMAGTLVILGLLIDHKCNHDVAIMTYSCNSIGYNISAVV